MIPAIRLYQYLAPAILTPVSLHLWWSEYGVVAPVLVSWLIPILWAYIVPAVGANVCKVWEFDVHWKLGRFRPHHGFVFGSATAMLAWLVHGAPARDAGDVLRFGLIEGSVLGFWNLLYEVKALRAGVLKVYNEPWARGQGEEAVAFDYAPWFFGGFGAAHGLAIGALEYLAPRHEAPGLLFGTLYFATSLALCIAVPVLGFMRHSMRTHGHPGTRPIGKESLP